MTGTSRFMMRMASDVPSGYDPKRRMSTVITPRPTAYKMRLYVHLGEVA